MKIEFLRCCVGFVAGAAISFVAQAQVGDGTPGPLYDPDSVDVGTLQASGSVLGAYPQDGQRRPDWALTLKRGLIAPRETRTGAVRAPEPMGAAPEAGIVFANTREMPHVVFPHAPHVEWLSCSNCHDGLFERKATGRGLGMEAILVGQHCGACHGRVAFSPEGSCYRCHVLPHANSFAPTMQTAEPDVPASRWSEMFDAGETRQKSRRRSSAGGSGAPVMPARPE